MAAIDTLPTILVVDDEPQVLAALADSLEDDFTILVEVSPLNAIDKLREKPDLSVIISDQRMPGLSGHEFLARARDLSDATRILITGYSDTDAVISAVNAGGIFGYISKPWDVDKLRQLVRHAADHYGLMRALAEERRLLHSLMNNMPDAIYFKDRERRFLRSNQAYARSLGLQDPALLIGKTVADVLGPEHTVQMDLDDAQVLKTGIAMVDRPSLVETEDNRKLWLSTTMAPILNGQQRVTGIVAIARDVTARRKAEDELRKAHDTLEQRVKARTADLTLANDKLRFAYERLEAQALDLAAKTTELAAAHQAAEAASEAKSRFLAVVSHELRTPLTGLIGTAELMLRSDLEPAEVTHFLELQRDSAQALHALVNDILDLSKIEAGRLDLEAAPFELRSVASGCVGLVAHTARAKGIALQTIIDDAVPEWLLGDSTRLRQIILNLLTNAVKFTDSGEVLLTVEAVAGGQGEERFRVTVADTGIGIPADRVEYLFQPFTQADSSTTRRFGGTGLGLAICKQLVELMHGTIGVETTVGQGSSFWFELALERTDPPQDVVTGVAAASAGKRRILLAEDSPVIQTLVATILRKAGHEVEIVGNGVAAVEAAISGNFDIVLMDAQMPLMGGLEATREIRARETGERRLPIVALTANATEQDVEQCLASGMDRFLSKPINMGRLLAVVSEFAAGQQDPDS